MTDITGNIGNTSTFIDDAPNDVIIKVIGRPKEKGKKTGTDRENPQR